ncbi:Protein of unknown function DUF541 [Rhodovulum sp. P5]|nr:Protein of unknown function DUF541 [Rhodovulum sp. P5]
MTVSGYGAVDVIPDMATVTLGVTHEARTADRAMAAVSDDLSAVLDGLRSAGIADTDLQTSGLDLSPVWSSYGSGQRREITGFVASSTVTARLRELDRLGVLLDEVIADGANGFRGLSFGVQDRDPILDAARRAAVQDARAKAKLYADAAGVALGPILLIEEGGVQTPRPMMLEGMRAASDAVPVAPGEVTISASVTMVFQIGE